MSTPETSPTSRQRLVTAAIELIAEAGWAGVTTRAVAERAGVNPGLVHYHLGSIHSLCLEATVTALEDQIERPARSALGIDDDAEALRAVARDLAGFGADQPGNRVLLEAIAQSSRDPELAELLASTVSGLRDRIAARLADRGNSRELATAVAAMLDGLALYRAIDPDIDVVACVEAIIPLLTEEHP